MTDAWVLILSHTSLCQFLWNSTKLPRGLWKLLHKSSGRGGKTCNTGTSRTCFLSKTPFSIVPHSPIPSYIMFKMLLRFLSMPGFPLQVLILQFILWIAELLLTKPALNNMLCKMKRTPKATHSSQDPAPCHKTLQVHGSMWKAAGPHFIRIKINHSATWKPVGLGYFIDTAVKGKTGNKKCSFSKHCCLETLYF